MNIMAQAHKATKAHMALFPNDVYAAAFRVKLILAHKAFKQQLVNLKDEAYKALVNNDEGGGQVYLDNAFSEVAHLMNRHQFAGYLSALNLGGKYQPQGDKEFGLVL